MKKTRRQNFSTIEVREIYLKNVPINPRTCAYWFLKYILLLTLDLADDVCVSRSSILLFSLLAALVQLMISLFCCICCARRQTRYVNSPSLPSHTSLGRCKVPTDTWSGGPGRRPLPAPLSHYFNRID